MNASHIDYMIEQAEQDYGTALGRIIGKGISTPEKIAGLLAIATRHEALIKLRVKYLTPAPVIMQEIVSQTNEISDEDQNEAEHDDMIPDGICNSESCTDEFCLEYWESVENNE